MVHAIKDTQYVKSQLKKIYIYSYIIVTNLPSLADQVHYIGFYSALRYFTCSSAFFACNWKKLLYFLKAPNMQSSWSEFTAHGYPRHSSTYSYKHVPYSEPSRREIEDFLVFSVVFIFSLTKQACLPPL